ncbi:MAG TPA: hypothetical protein GX003_04130 [Acholeplasmataceae bacterium]|nr:hypothetical protein [Acholeplasmataceae bacterium]
MNQNQQVDKILELRNEGFGYKRIANELKTSIGMVRYTIAKAEKNTLSGFCKNCGIKTLSVKGKKAKKFCSDRCRYKWWNNHRKGKEVR